MSRIDNGTNMPKEMTEQHKNHYKETMPCNELWTDGLLCAFEYVKGPRRPIKSKVNTKSHSTHQANTHKTKKHDDGYSSEPTGFTGGDVIDVAQYIEKHDGSHWVPIGWDRISELVKTVQINGEWEARQFDFLDDEDERTIADLVAPYWERPAGPVWWCNVAAVHPHVSSWLNNASWLHPAISIALRDESRLISERMKHLLYEVH